MMSLVGVGVFMAGVWATAPADATAKTPEPPKTRDRRLMVSAMQVPLSERTLRNGFSKRKTMI